MTEKEWLACDDVESALRFIDGRVSGRKLRLFACCCFQHLAARHPLDASSQTALETSLGYVEGSASAEELGAAYRIALENANHLGQGRSWPDDPDNKESAIIAWWIAIASTRLVSSDPYEAYFAQDVVRGTRRSFGKYKDIGSRLEQEHGALLRHIIGNPFRPYPAPRPSTVVQLAESLYAGQDCAFALHDALLEAGHAELGEHFREEKSHPKGCWAMDLILGKA
jgi:hypothetical protein